MWITRIDYLPDNIIRGAQVRSILVDKKTLRDIVEKNRAEHRSIFDEAQISYRERVIQELDRRLTDAKAGRKINTVIQLPVPEDHSDDYDRVLRMIDLEVGDQMTLEEDDIAQYVQDDWNWKRAWIGNTVSYTNG